VARVKPLSTGNQSWSVLACSSRVGVCISLSVRLDWCPSKSAGLETRDASPTTEHTAHPTGAPPAAQDPASVGLSAAP
jgi:hypothetical protein